MITTTVVPIGMLRFAQHDKARVGRCFGHFRNYELTPAPGPATGEVEAAVAAAASFKMRW